MILHKFSFFLILMVSLAVIGCDKQDSNDKAETVTNVDNIEQPIQQNPQIHVPQTVAGDYLAGQFAQSQSDWQNAASYFSEILKEDTAPKDIERRILALQIGSGSYDDALKTSQTILATPDADKTLAQLFMALSLFKDGKYAESMKQVDGYKEDALGFAVLPLLKTWNSAAEGKADISELKDSPALLYQAVLVAAYTKDKNSISKLAKEYDFTKTSTPVYRLSDIADVFASFGEKTDALEIYRALTQALPGDAEKYKQKIEQIDASPYNPETPQFALSSAFLDMAQILSNGYADSARLFAHMALYLNPQNDFALELLAHIATQNGLYNEATSYLTRITTDNAPDKLIVVNRQIAQLQTMSGNNAEAIRILQKLVDDTKNIESQIQIGDIYRSEENYKEALKAYNKAYDMIGGNITDATWDLAFARGIANERLKNWEQAEKDLQTALSFQPDQPYVLNYLGYSWADQGINLDKAAEMIEKAVRLRPNDGAIVDSLGWIYFRMGEYDKAVKTLERAIELASTEPELNDHLGDAYWKVGRKTEAKFQWKRAISFSTDADFIQKTNDKVVNGLQDSPSK